MIITDAIAQCGSWGVLHTCILRITEIVLIETRASLIELILKIKYQII